MCNLLSMTACRTATPGISVRGKIIAASSVLTMPKTEKEIGEAGGSYTYELGDGVRYGEAFALKPTKKWLEVEFVISSGELTAKAVGEAGLKSFQNDLMAKFSGTHDEVRDFVQNLNDCCGGWILAVPTLDDPTVAAIIGSVDSPCAFDMPNMKTGKKAGDESSAEVMFSDLSGRIWRSYPIALGLPIV